MGYFYLTGDTLKVTLSSEYNYYPIAADAVRVQALVGDRSADDNFSVLFTSPTIDAGDPLWYYLAEPGPNGGRNNLGHTGNTAHAVSSPAERVQVLAPNGLEKFELGQQLNLQWLFPA